MNIKQHMNYELLPESYWNSSMECSECTHRIGTNTPEMYSKKEQALEGMRRQISSTPFQSSSYKGFSDHQQYISNLREDGRFADLNNSYGEILEAIQRLVAISECYHWAYEKPCTDRKLKHRIFRAVAYYCGLEADREDLAGSRFHSSIFAIPTATTNIFFFFLPDMEAVEQGVCEDHLTREVHKQLLRCSLQTWTLPLRNDHTDKHPISPERFRKHVWWVGANALAYRPIFYVAVMFKSVEMMDTLAYVASNILTPTSNGNNDESFWSEGICADGFGWGHGRQAYNHGYPSQGIMSGLEILKYLKGTPWEVKVRDLDMYWLVNFIRGITWGQYKGWNAPMQTRHMFIYRENGKLPYSSESMVSYVKDDYNLPAYIAEFVIDNFSDLLTYEQLKEMNQLHSERSNFIMDGYPSGYYKGIRYFWNNDDLIKKTDNFYIYINMASSRCDGVESAYTMADKLNLFTADGSYVIAKSGDEYIKSVGAWKMTALPGITARQVDTEKLVPEINWSGYNSIHGYAGGVTYNENGAAGFIFEKDDRRKIDGSGTTYNDYSREIFGVKAHKSYFIIKDSIVCLGAGITDKCPNLGSEICTTINQTEWAADIIYHKAGGNPVETFKSDGDRLNLVFKGHGLESDIPWVKQNGILYAVFPDQTPGEIKVTAEQRMSHWHLLNNTNNSVENESYKMFQMWINHGEEPQEDKYGYLMYTGDMEPQDYLESNTIRIIENTTNLQAVEDTGNKLVEAVFYSSDAVCKASGWDMKVSAPAVVMVEHREKALVITVNDPYQDEKLDKLNVYITVPVVGDNIADIDGWYGVTVDMPRNPEIGKPKTVMLELK